MTVTALPCEARKRSSAHLTVLGENHSTGYSIHMSSRCTYTTCRTYAVYARHRITYAVLGVGSRNHTDSRNRDDEDDISAYQMVEAINECKWTHTHTHTHTHRYL